MKKILVVLVMGLIMMFNGLCFAADGNDLNKEQKIAEDFMQVFWQEQLPNYSKISETLSGKLKIDLNEKQYIDLQKNVKDKFGILKEAKFYSFQRFDQGDRVSYLVSFDKQPISTIIFAFDKNQKLENYAIVPLQKKTK
ncbi:DUF3887 domain-containing protein [Megamonas hypermegale]|uniref:DUF3887 domain-containing protein n=1 Tax=Megamonas hypermegale TaxID=158847 RepID=UPI00195CA12A|nr:DUF3887 domain-containing protein [Megamonas hypermegale]MBM6834293.1 DUF3887 domain-containing protein [Megamonas hypermegale]